MRGRKPKPTAVKVLEGNPGKRALNGHEPIPRRRLPRCPDHLSETAKREWRRVAGELYDAGLLTGVDRAALAAYSQAWGRWVEAEEKLTKTGAVIKTSNGNPIQNPYLAIANRAVEQMYKFAVEFGMTPSSRSRIHVEPPDKEMSLAEMLFENIGSGEDDE